MTRCITLISSRCTSFCFYCGERRAFRACRSQNTRALPVSFLRFLFCFYDSYLKRENKMAQTSPSSTFSFERKKKRLDLWMAPQVIYWLPSVAHQSSFFYLSKSDRLTIFSSWSPPPLPLAVRDKMRIYRRNLEKRRPRRKSYHEVITKCLCVDDSLVGRWWWWW